MIAVLSDIIGTGHFLSQLCLFHYFLPESMAQSPEQLMIIVGFGGQALFASRFIIQWIKSEGAKKSVIPVAFLVFLHRRGHSVIALCYLASRSCDYLRTGAWSIYLCA